MASGALLGGQSSSELATLENGQKKIADDIAQLTSIVLRVQGDIAKLLGVARPDGAAVQTPPHQSSWRYSHQPPLEHAVMPFGEQEQQAVQSSTRSSVPVYPSQASDGLAFAGRGSGDAQQAMQWPTCSSVPVDLSQASDGLAFAGRGSGDASERAGSTFSGTERGQCEDRNSGTYIAGDTGEPPVWPVNIALREVFKMPRGPAGASRPPSWSRGISRGSSFGSGLGTRRGVSCLMIDPTSKRRALFDLMSIAVLVYDLLVTPYVLAWDIAFGGWLAIGSWSTCVLWTTDIILSFMTGIYEQGRLVLNARDVALKYVRTWLVPDVCVACCDWASIIMMSIATDSNNASGSLRILRFGKIGRLMRIPAMLRTLKYLVVLEEYVESQLSDTRKAALKIYVLSFGTLIANHWITCGWMAVGRIMPSDTGRRWIDTAWVVNGQQVDFMEADQFYQYTTALHWSVAQFTLGAIEISCSNSLERIFNMACLFIGLLFGSTLVSVLSTTMVDSQMRKKERTAKLRKLRLFLRENPVTRQVAKRVERQVANRLDEKERLREQDVPALQLLSTQLRKELRYGIFKQHLLTHPIFRLWHSLDPCTLQDLCESAVSHLFLRAKDDLFAVEAKTDAAYYVVSGTLQYYGDHCAQVQQGAWLCEAALWTEWAHVGRLEASTPSQLVVLFSDELVKVLHQPAIREITMDYARSYHRTVVKAREPTDVEIPLASWTDVAMGMSHTNRVAISLQSLKGLGEQSQPGITNLWRTDRHDLEVLRDEALNRKSCFFTSTSGEVERVVPILVLRIERPCDQDTQVLVKLGTLQNGQMEPSCQLPSSKLQAGECPEEAMGRFLRRRLEAFCGKVKVESASREDRHGPDEAVLKLRTRYHRTVWTLSMTGSVDALSFGCPTPMLARGSGSGRKASRIGRMASRRSALTSRDLPRREWEVLAVHDHEDAAPAFFAWLTDEEFECISSMDGAVLSMWLGVLQQHYEPRAAADAVVAAGRRSMPL